MIKHYQKKIAALVGQQAARLAKDEEGAALVEYGLLVSLIAAVCVLSVTALGVGINGVFTAINTALGF